MSIPHIEAYDLPAASELPQNRLPVTVDPKRAALLVHDAQQYFLDFFGPHNNTLTSVVGNMVALRDACTRAGIPTVFTAQPPVQSQSERGLLQDMWGPGITAHPARTEICSALTPQAEDLVLTKWRYSAFAKTSLLSWLRESGRTQLIICGVYAHIGCQCTAAEAFMSDIVPILVSDAVADFSRAKHLSALGYVAGCCGLVHDTEHLLSAIRAASTALGAQSLQDELRADVARLLEVNVDAITVHTSLFDIGLDSVRLMTLLEEWRGKGYVADLIELADVPTIEAWTDRFTRMGQAV